MKNFLLIAITGVLFYSCGEAGVGFNIGKEFPITIPVEFDDIPQPPLGEINPPAFDESISYTLDQVDAFEGVDIGEVIVSGFAYEISGVEASENENVEVESISLIFSADGDPFATIDIDSQFSGTTFEDVAKTALSESEFDEDALALLLLNGGEIKGDVTFDFAELPPESFDFDFTLYFDVLLKVREL